MATLEAGAVHRLQRDGAGQEVLSHFAGVLEADLGDVPPEKDGSIDDKAVSHEDRPGSGTAPRRSR